MSISEKTVCKWLKVYDRRSKRSFTVGVMVGVPIEGENGEPLFNADYSVCNENYDDFDRNIAWNIAYGRAMKAREKRAKQRILNRSSTTWYANQMRVKEEFDKFCQRCQIYFKDRQPAAKAKEVLDRIEAARAEVCG